MHSKLLAAVRFDDNQDVDGLLEDFAARQMARGAIVRGVLQSRGEQTGECHCRDMDLVIIGEGSTFRISQSLGEGSSGCRLHSGRLAECSAHLDHQLEQGCNLLVLNRFGKGESEGRGFRDLINKAFALDLPVLLAVRPTYMKAWLSYVGNCAEILPPEFRSLEKWFEKLENEVGESTNALSSRGSALRPNSIW